MRFMHLYYAFLAVVVGTFVACDVSQLAGSKDGAKSGTSSVQTCFVTATPSEVAKGEGVTITPGSDTIWDELSSITIDDQIMTVSKPSLVINPHFTRTYSVVAARKDGNVQSCTLKITVTDTDELGCTLSASPAAIQKDTATTVTATLQVLGAATIVKTSIDGLDLNSTVGGAKEFDMSNARVLIGRVDAEDGTYATCAFAVGETGGPVAEGECTKVEPDATDIAAFTAKQDELNVENKATLDAVTAEATPDGYDKIEAADYEANGIHRIDDYFNKDDCKQLAQHIAGIPSDQVTCSQGEVKDVNSIFRYVYMEVEGKHYDVYMPREYSNTFSFHKNGSGDVATVILQENLVSAATVDVTLCECDMTAIPNSDSEEGIMAPPMLYAVERPDAAPAEYKGAKVWEYENKRAYFKKTYLETKPGFKKPACPIQHHVDT